VKEFVLGFLQRHPELLKALFAALLDELTSNPKFAIDALKMLSEIK
jgi:hypothetical protein